MTITTWDGEVSSVCEKVSLLGGWRTTGTCSTWSAQTKHPETATGSVIWAQSETAAFARSLMPAMQLSSQAAPSHSEPRYYLFSGSQSASIEFACGRTIDLAPTEIVLLRMNDPLLWRIEKPYVGHSLVIGETMLRTECRPYERLVGHRLGFPYNLQEPLRELLMVAQRTLESDTFTGAGDDLAHAILRLLAMADPSIEPDTDTCFNEGVTGRGTQIRQFIDRNFRDPDLCIGRIADRFEISPRYIQLILAKNGLTASDLIRRLRVREAARMLRDQRQHHLSITEIAFDCGFNSSAYFSTEFRRAYGASPRTYRTMRN